MEQDLLEKLRAYNQIYREMDIFYHNYAQSVGLSDAAFWILYSLTEREKAFTQRELCTDWSFPPQTVNSALKALEKKCVIVLEPVPGNRKNKWIRFTPAGESLAAQAIRPLIEVECAGFAALSREEGALLLETTRKYAAFLKTHAAK